MRWLLTAVLTVAAIWAGMWFLGARTLERQLGGLLQDNPYLLQDGFAVQGFPNRLDVTLTNPRLRDVLPGAIWQAPQVQVYSMVWKPWHVIAALPGEQLLAWPGGSLTLRSDAFRVSVVATPSSALTLDRATLVADGLDVTGSDGARLSAEALRVATRVDATRQNAHDLGVEVVGLAPDAAALARLPQGSSLPERLDALHLDASVHLTAPVDRFLAQTRPMPDEIELRALVLRWGSIALDAKGTLRADERGFAEGRINLELADWNLALDASAALGLVQPGVAETWREFARRWSEAAGSGDRLTLPLVFSGGRMSLGPIPIGPAPRLGLAGPAG